MSTNSTETMPASSLQSIARSDNNPARTVLPLNTANATPSANMQSKSAVRPLIHSSAMLTPWKLNDHAATATSAVSRDADSLLARQNNKTASTKTAARFVMPYANGSNRHSA